MPPIGTEPGDGCCPAGCNADSDDDCSSSCDNAVVEVPEVCDTAIEAGKEGACPINCSDGVSCTHDRLLNAGTCDAQCSFTPVTGCSDGDKCCPTGCNAIVDSDGSPVCGNSVVETPELCDKAISAGEDGACPTSCDNDDPCTTDKLLQEGTCEAVCEHKAICQICRPAQDGPCSTGRSGLCRVGSRTCTLQDGLWEWGNCVQKHQPTAEMCANHKDDDCDGATDLDDPDCQEHDSDGDGIANDRDACPHLSEDFDGFRDHDGCPE